MTTERVAPDDAASETLFPTLHADDAPDVTEIESLCMNCQEDGVTRLMLTRIPFFKELIVSSFSCDACGFENREAQLGGRVQEKGVRFTLEVTTAEDLNRQVVKSDAALFAIPSLDFEHPPSRKADISTVEGLLDGVTAGLRQDQPLRRAVDAATADKIDAFIERLEQLKALREPFKIVLDDPSGNSFIENPSAPQKDARLAATFYTRTREQDVQIGVLAEEPVEETEEGAAAAAAPQGEDGEPERVTAAEVMSFRVNCPNCNVPCETNMKMTDIPFFKEVVIMATTCDACGHRDNEVKSGGGVAEEGTRIELRLTDPSDLTRDVLKSETCGLRIPELELETEHGTLGGKFTTVEGLLGDIRDQLSRRNPFFAGDSAQTGTRDKLARFCADLEKVISGERLDVTLILDDPAGNSYVQNLYAPDPDPEMKISRYTRDFEQNEMLGLNDMKTEGYELDS